MQSKWLVHWWIYKWIPHFENQTRWPLCSRRTRSSLYFSSLPVLCRFGSLPERGYTIYIIRSSDRLDTVSWRYSLSVFIAWCSQNCRRVYVSRSTHALWQKVSSGDSPQNRWDYWPDPEPNSEPPTQYNRVSPRRRDENRSGKPLKNFFTKVARAAW